VHPLQTTRRLERALLVGLILAMPCLLGATYKWTDAQGQVHLSDVPPPAGTLYETIPAPHTNAPLVLPKTQAVPTSPSSVASPHAPAATSPATSLATSPATSPATAPAAASQDARCVDALYQLELLVGKWKVYKPGPGDARTYLDDKDRPAEIQRLTRERDANCTTVAVELASQKRRANEMFQALSAGCREAREKLANLQRPTARSSPDDIERQREYIARYCPVEVNRDDVWLADWVWQWHTQ
jgi:hypothetical protein